MDTFKYRKEDEAREQNLKQFEAICRVEYEQNRVVLSQNSQKMLPIPIQLYSEFHIKAEVCKLTRIC